MFDDQMMSEENRKNSLAHKPWSCECIICKTFVYPVLLGKRRNEYNTYSYTTISQTEELETETIQQKSTQTETIQHRQSSIDVEKLSEAITTRISSSIENKLGSFNQRIDMIEGEVKNVRENFEKSLDELRDALIDVRAAIAEFTNPFNVLKSQINTSNNLQREEVKKQVISFLEKTLQQNEKNSNETSSNKNNNVDAVIKNNILSDKIITGANFRNPVEAILNLYPDLGRGVRRLGLGGVIKLMKWIDELIDRIPRDVVEELSKFMSSIGIISEEEKNVLISIIEFVYRARKMGIKVNEQIVYIYTLAKIFGLSDSEADAEILRMAVNSEKLGIQ